MVVLDIVYAGIFPYCFIVFRKMHKIMSSLLRYINETFMIFSIKVKDDDNNNNK